MIKLDSIKPSNQPMIMKYIQPFKNGIQSHNLTRHGIGYVPRGQKYIYDGDTRKEINRGDIFYLGSGCHYMEDVPEENRPFEQIIFYYTNEQLSHILNNLSIIYKLNINNTHSCEECRNKSHIVYPAWSMIKNFFTTINHYIKEDVFNQDSTAENIKITELIYLIVTQEDCCLTSKILSNIDLSKESFEQTIQKHIFEDISINELAGKCNRSLTSFKKEFKRHYFDPPHKWFIKQRLMHSRLLLISTDKSVSEIGIECNFPNTSHFIKLFKKEYCHTPASYRHNHLSGKHKNTFVQENVEMQ
ncbi:MAG: AraC family transcriptional regulator [Rikenellaceae bacterium]